MNKLICFLFIIHFIFCINSLGQTYKISGRIETKSKPVKYCEIEIINEEDTSEHYSAISDSNGFYKFNLLTKIPMEKLSKPIELFLYQNYPNPFSENTIISYKLPRNNKANIKIYNILGQEVRNIKDASQSTGINQYLWDGKDNSGKKVAKGVYFYRLESEGLAEIKKMINLFNNNGYSNFFSFPESINDDFNYRKGTCIKGKYYKIALSNSEDTKPLIRRKEIKNVFINGDTTINIEADQLKGKILFVKKDSIYNMNFIYKMDIDGSKIIQLTFPKDNIDTIGSNYYYRNNISELMWSADGKMILFKVSSYEYSYIVLMNEDQSKKIAFHPSIFSQYIRWSRESNKIFMGDVNRYAIVDIDGNIIRYFDPPQKGLFEGDSINFNFNRIQWYHDEQHFYIFGNTKKDSTNNRYTEIFLIELTSGKVIKRITYNEIDESQSIISPDETRIIIDGFIPLTGMIKIMYLNNYKSNLISIANGFSPKWSNDGKYIIFAKSPTYQNYQTYLVDPDKPFVEIKVPVFSFNYDLFIEE